MTPTPPENDASPRVSASALLAASRAVAELRLGREISIEGDTGVVEVAALEMVSAARPSAQASPDGSYALLLSAERAQKLGLETAGDPVTFHLSSEADTSMLQQLAGLAADPWPAEKALPPCEVTSAAWALAALELARQGQLAPALFCHIDSGTLLPADRIRVGVSAALSFRHERGRALERVSDAPVPLADCDDCQFIVWRERYADFEHLAIVVGQPAHSGPVLTRIHSSCLTGDLFASLRCDCGEQLRGAIARMAAEGGGVLLYLAQEGRGIGLVNKLRAYRLQDAAHDTLEADRTLGFRADERDYTIASTMLTELGVTQVRLLTNNPRKMDALTAAGIEVTGRVAISVPANRYNARYIQTKRERAGHLGPESDEQA